MVVANQMTKEERSLLLFLETQVVDHYGRVETVRMNEEDMLIAAKWDKIGFITFRRRKFKAIKKEMVGVVRPYEVRFTDEAWLIAHRLRRERSERMVLKGEEMDANTIRVPPTSYFCGTS